MPSRLRWVRLARYGRKTAAGRSSMVWQPTSVGRSRVRRLSQQAPMACFGGRRGSTRSLRLLWHVPGRQRGAFTEEEVLHVLGDEILRFLLPGHEPVLVQDHLHALFPEFPRVLGHVFEDALTKLARPQRRIVARQLLLKLRAPDLAAAPVRRT